MIFDKKEDHSYKAEFSPLSSVTGLLNHGYSLNGSLWWATSKEIAHRNALIVGPSGSGKTSTVLIGTIHSISRGKSSMAILDVSGEVHALTSTWLRKMGYKVYVINFGANSDSFNPLLGCLNMTDVLKIAFLLIKNSGIENRSDPYWSASGEMMLALFIEYLVFHAEKKYCSMFNLVRLVTMFAAEPRKVDMLMIRTGNEDLITRYKAMNAVSEKTLQSTLSTVRTAIKVFDTPQLRSCTATSTVDFAKFRHEKSVLYICTPLNDVNYYAPLSALLFEALFKEMMSRIPEKGENSIFCLIDELASMRFTNPGLVWANARKYSSACMGIIQDEKMLEMCCSPVEAHAIKTNSYCKVYLPGQPLATCKSLEEILGRYTYSDEKGERTRLLMTASEIRTCEDALILCGNKPPVRAKLRPYYESFILRQRAKLPPYINEQTTISEPPLLPFDEA